MKVMSLRALARLAASLDEAVLVTSTGRVIGRFVPATDEEAGGLSAAPRVEPPAATPTRLAPGSAGRPGGFGQSHPAPKPGR